MKSSFSIRNFFVVFSLAACAGLCAPAFGQSVIGEWELIGRKCSGKNHLISIGNTAQIVTFHPDGDVQYESVDLHKPITREEFRERAVSEALERFEESKQNHEELCRSGKPVGEEDDNGNFIDLCTRSGKNHVYDKWRNSYLQEAESYFNEHAPPEGSDGPCRIESYGRWSLNGKRLTVELDSTTADPACGMEGGGGAGRQISGNIYFKDGDLYWSLPPIEESRKLCGSSNYEMILFLR